MNAHIVHPGAGPDLRPRTADGWTSGVAMAVGVHLMLVAALAFGVHWKMSPPEVVEAEVWSDIPRAAVPEAAEPPPPQVVQPAEKPPETPPEPVKAAEPEPPPPQPIPDVVVDRTPPKKEPKKRKPKEPVEVFETEPPKPVKKPEKLPPKKPVETKPAPKPEPKPVTSKVSSAESSAKAAAEREAIRKAKLQEMMSELGSLGTPSRSAGPSAAYGGRIKARIKPNIVFTDNVSGNPLAVVEVRCGPDGRILSTKFIERSGLASWDEAVMRALERTEVLPADETGRVPPVMQLEFRPKDF
ncbi:MAG: TonB C-terminal domain-containing protein [Aquabacterium sp.]|nr:TonB C-terminal domain-containing protein [Aquabacterium sp.]